MKEGALPGAQIFVEPTKVSVASDSQGKFTLSGVAPGTYNVTISYIGFAPFMTSAVVSAGQTANIDAVLQVASETQQVLVTATQVHGEAEAINQERTTSNIVDVLPANIITSLPNANIADAVGRLPSVTLERDEGEGKYVQIRGTEPRLSNLTIDGIQVPSPEGGVRQVKLDTIPADLVQSVQVFKTLEADQPGDAIGGSVNIETKTAGDQPVLSLYGMGGFTPIINTVPVAQAGATAGKRFGAQKRLGLMVSGSFDYNGRGINDIEPIPAVQGGPPFFTSMDLRDYYYDRKRYGIGGSVDYRLGSASSLFARTLFSDFKDFGHRYDYAIQDQSAGVAPTLTTERRLGDYQIGDVILGGDHASGKWTFRWEVSVARARMLNPINGGESITTFTYVPTTSNCLYNQAATSNPYLPQFSPACFTEAYNPANFALTGISDSAHGLAAQLNLQGSASAVRSYFLGSHPGLFQFGAWFSNAHKYDNSYEIDYTPAGAVSMTPFVDGFHDPHYYGNAYQFGPGVSWEGVNGFLAANPSAFMPSTSTAGGNSNNFELVERIPAGYLMNTLSFGRFTLITGVRFEGTQDHTLSFDSTAAVPCLCLRGSNSYLDVLPSASLAIGLGKDSDIRLAYGRGISRPDPQFLTTATNLDTSTIPPTITFGNPALKSEHANDYDLLYERFLNPVGAVRAGFFYKSINGPIVQLRSGPTNFSPLCTLQFSAVGCFISQAGNAGKAYITGVELSFEQHFTYLPGLLRGLGVFANYSYTTSQATNVNPGFRNDRPALLRQAPNTWNISPTYDRGRLSLRVGLAYNGPNIFQYAFTACQNGQTVNPDGSCNVNPNDPVNTTPTPTPGGIRGPGGDLYLFGHFQVDAQASFRLVKGWTFLAEALNLNNEVFGFYQGSSQYFIQREFYKPTYTFGFRWDRAR